MIQKTICLPQHSQLPPTSVVLRYRSRLVAPALLALFVAVWEGVIWMGEYPAFILPSPTQIVATLSQAVLTGLLWHHAQITLLEILAGLSLGLTTASLLGYLLAKNRPLEQLVAPYVVASQSVPVIAIAPLLIIWFGAGYLSKVLICALILFFPVLVNTIVAIRSVEQDLRELMRSLGANRWQTFYLLELPAALPIFLGGVKVGVTLSVIGAVVGEFIGANQGLGFLINQARGLFNTPLVFVAILSLVAIALTLYGMVNLLESRLLRWRSQ
jgi:NitT/TauT family transport system permease protein